jgi:hypothetical protein
LVARKIIEIGATESDPTKISQSALIYGTVDEDTASPFVSIWLCTEVRRGRFAWG